jgi:hypothetical protein
MLREALIVTSTTLTALGGIYFYRRQKRIRTAMIRQRCLDQVYNYDQVDSKENADALMTCIRSTYTTGMTGFDLEERVPFPLSK